MLHRIVAAGFENVEEADDVRMNVTFRVRDGIADARLCRKVHDDVRLAFREQRVKRSLVRNVNLAEGEAFAVLREHFKPLFFKRCVVVVRDAVRADNARAFKGVKDMLGKKTADKARGSCHEDCFVGK